MNVRNSNTLKGEKLTYMQLKPQWNITDWKKVEKHVNHRFSNALKSS